MAAAAEAGAEGTAVEYFVRSDRYLALIITHLADNKADYAALDLAGDTGYIIAVVFNRSGILHHFARYRRGNNLAVEEILKPREYAALERHACARHLTEEIKVQLLYLGAARKQLACRGKGLARHVCIAEAAAVGRHGHIQKACLLRGEAAAQFLYDLQHDLTAGSLAAVEQQLLRVMRI